MTFLRHIALPSWPNAPVPKYPTYNYAWDILTKLRRTLIAWKAADPETRGPPPPPTLVSFTPAPIFTFGRRQLSHQYRDSVLPLTHPLQVVPPSSSSSEEDQGLWFRPEIEHAPRGGLTTYHGPGQVVFWPVIDLRSPLHARFLVRDYTCLLEKTTIAALEQTTTTTTEPSGEKAETKRIGKLFASIENPGVWVTDDEREERKIAALGVYLRRHVTGLGVAVNYATPVTGPKETNPWARIVACGIGDKGVTSVKEEEARMRRMQGGEEEELPDKEGDDEVAMKRLADTWAREFAQRLGATGVEPGALEDVSGKGSSSSYTDAYVEAKTLSECMPVDEDFEYPEDEEDKESDVQWPDLV
ncbi:hypothetical protein F4810DRAFT_317653 [Camillea tinctor]|nr:hypothetical protein F4810DRAFT_317653 [Camillea tinctor]